MRFETLAVHAGGHLDETTGAVAPPLHLSTTFGRDALGNPVAGHSYIRDSNPNQSSLETALAALEGGAAALAFSSGMGAASALLQALPAGAHVVLPEDLYYGVRAAARDYLSKWGMTWDAVPMHDLAALREALRPETRLVWLESPSNPLIGITDLAAATAIAHEKGARVVVDNTFATPVLQRPLDLGADVALHSTTKYMGGHSDVIGGALVFREAGLFHEEALHARHILGAVASPFASWLVLRGLRTLPVRVERQARTAHALATWLETHPRVEAVHYPGLPSHPGHEVAARQMSAFGAMLSFRVKGSREETLAVSARVALFTRATSLGGVESLLEHRATSEGPGSTTPENLLRVSVGLEHEDDLRADLDQALAG